VIGPLENMLNFVNGGGGGVTSGEDEPTSGGMGAGTAISCANELCSVSAMNANARPKIKILFIAILPFSIRT